MVNHSEGENAVANRAETTITLTDAPRDHELAVIAERLRAYNEAQAGYSDSRALAVLVRDPKTKRSSAACTAARHWASCG